MRDYVKKQLLSLELAIPSSYDEKTNTYFIPRYTKPIYKVGKSYLVKLPDNYISLMQGWGNKNYPKSNYLKIIVKNTLGKSINVDALEIDPQSLLDTERLWFGYLNTDYIEQIKKID